MKKRISLVLVFLIANTVPLFAQFIGGGSGGGGGDDGPGSAPCGGADIDGGCPLDTWVIILAAIALIFTTLYLYRKQKTESIA